MVIACEVSGDIAGASLVQKLHDLDPGVEVLAVGGARLKAQKVQMLHDSSKWGTVGVWEAFPKAPGIFLAYRQIKHLMRARRPDLVVLIDSPAINLPLARHARQHGLRTVYYFPPSQWTESLARHRRIASKVDHVIAAFEFTANKYKEAGAPVQYFGHPILDWLKDTPSREQAREMLNVPPGKTVMGVLPGSRPQEVNHLLPVLLEAAGRLKRRVPELHLVLPVASPNLRSAIETMTAGHAITIVNGQAQLCMAASDVIIMASGTASLEAAVLGVPMVITYRLPRFDYALGRMLRLRVRWMGLPNLVVQRDIVPELLQEEASPERISELAGSLLLDPDRRAIMQNNLAEVRSRLGHPGSSFEIARFVYAHLQSPLPD